MATSSIACPWCSKAIESDDGFTPGGRVRCPRCGADFALRPEDLRAAAMVTSSPPPVPPRVCLLTPPAAPTLHSNAGPLVLGAGALAMFLITAVVGLVMILPGRRSPEVAALPSSTSAPMTPTVVVVSEPVSLPDRRDDERAAVPVKPPMEESPPSPPPPVDPPPPPAKAPPALPPPEAPPKLTDGPAPPRPAPALTPAVFKRRDRLGEEDLREQLLLAPELALDSPGDVRAATSLFAVALNARARNVPYPGPSPFVRQRPDLAGLPLTMGLDCQLGKEPAENLQALSRKLREHVAACLPKDGLDPRPDADALRTRLMDDDARQWLTPEAVPCLLQMLQPENKPVRMVLVEVLGRIPGQRATAALAMRAVMDLSPEVREEAVNQLRGRPPEESRDLLLHALRYPWAPVIDHAAEALGDKEAAPALVPLLEQPDPALPAFVKKDKEEIKLVPELVRVNHLRNCVLCHSPSLDLKDMVRGAVPAPGKPLPAPASTPQYYESGERFVRADVTYLRQDFSVMQPVAQLGAWPEYQRFDYLVRLRRPRQQEYEAVAHKKKPLGDEPREAVLFALRELTGRDAGATAASWRTALGKAVAEKPAAEAPVGDDWKQFRTALQPGADGPLSAEADRLKDQFLAAEGPARADFIRRLSENADRAGAVALARAVPVLAGETQSQARDALADCLGRLPEAELCDRLADDNPEIRRAAARACAHREDKGKGMAADLIPMLADDDVEVAGAAHTVLTAATGQDFGPAPGAAAADREKARTAWEAWRQKQGGS